MTHNIPLFSTADGKLKFELNYNSRAEFKSPLGMDWTTGLHGEVKHSYGIVKLQTGRGRVLHFKWMSGAYRPRGIDPPGILAGGNWWRGDVNYWLLRNSIKEFELYDRDGTVYTYTAWGTVDDSWGIMRFVDYPGGYRQTHLHNQWAQNTEIVDSLGRRIRFTYHPNGLLATAEDPDGKIYSFTYTSSAGPVTPAAIDNHKSRAYLDRVYLPDETPTNTTDNPFIQMHYETIGSFLQLTGITDERGVRVATWTYQHGQAVSSEGPGGFDRWTLSFNPFGHIQNVTNALGKVWNYQLEQTDGVSILNTGIFHINGVSTPATTNTQATSSVLELDNFGRIMRTIGPDGQRVRYERNQDWRGLPTLIQRGENTPQSSTTTITWHATKPIPTQITTPGLTTAFNVTPVGLVLGMTQTDTTSQSAPYSTNGQTRTWAYTYLPNGGDKITSIDGPLPGTGDTVTYAYTPDGSLSSITNEVGHVTIVNSVNGRGQPLSVTDPNGVVTTFDYHPRGWIKSITQNPGANQRVTSFQYDLAGNLTRVTKPGGGWISYAYNPAGLVSSATSSLGDVAEYSYDLLGNLTSSTRKTSGGSSNTFTQTFQYDELGRLMKTLGAANQTTTFGYDKSNRLTSITDPRSKLYANAFDALNRLITTTDPDNDVETNTYNGKDELATFKDGRNLTTTYVRNGFGDVIREVSPDRGTTDYWYDAGGRLIKRVDAKGQEVLYAYDNADRLLSETFTGATLLNRTYTYDSVANGNPGKGRLTAMTDSKGAQAYFYSPFGEVLSQARVTNGQTFTIAYLYDVNGDISRIVYPDGRQVDYTRDALGRVASVATRADAGATLENVTTSVGWRPWGPLSGYTSGNGLVTAYAYDTDYRLTSIKVDTGTTNKRLDLAYTYDAASNILNITDGLVGFNSDSYTYTNDNRLASSASPNNTSVAWAYDANGNRTQETKNASGVVTTQAYSYAPTSNRLVDLRNASAALLRAFVYDANGNVMTDDRQAAGIWSYAYDADGRMSQVLIGGQLKAEYAYDGWGQRITRQVYGSGTLARSYVYGLDGEPLAEMDGTGAVLRTYVWLEGRLVAMVAGTTLYHVHAGHLGQPLKMTDSSKAVVWDADLEPFGQATVAINTVSQDIRLPGQWEQFEAGLFQNWNRDYDPTLGRYIQADPIGLAGGSNLYGYVGGEPLGRVDPRGLAALGRAIGAGLGGWGGRIGGGAAGGLAGGGGAIPGSMVGGWAGRAVGGMIGSAIEDALFPPAPPTAISIPDYVPGDVCPLPNNRPSISTPALAVLPGPVGAAEWGRKNPAVGPSEAADRFHKWKQKDRSQGGGRGRDDYRVDTDTGDVIAPDGEVVGNLGDKG